MGLQAYEVGPHGTASALATLNEGARSKLESLMAAKAGMVAAAGGESAFGFEDALFDGEEEADDDDDLDFDLGEFGLADASGGR